MERVTAGLMLDSIRLRNIVYYKDAELDLSYEGITTIYGHNKNAVRAKHRTNAAGKSLLTSTIPNITFNSNPALSTIGARSAKTKQSLLDTPTSSMWLSTRKLEGDKLNRYVIQKFRKGSQVRYAVEKNGKDMDFATPTKAERWVQNFVPFNQDAFYLHTYLDGRRPYMLNVGSAVQRAEIFSNLFRMEGFDYLKDECASMRKDLLEDSIRLGEIRKRRIEAESVIEGLDFKALRAELRDKKLRRKDLKAKASKLYDRQSDLKLYAANRTTIKALRRIQKDLSDKAIGKLIDRLESDLKAAEKTLSNLRRYEQHLEALERFKEQTKKLRREVGDDKRSPKQLTEEIRELGRSRSKLEDAIDAATGKIRTFQSEIDRTRVDKPDKSKIQRVDKVCGKRDRSKVLAEYQDSVRTLETKLAASEKMAKLVGNLAGGDKCFVCETKLPHSHSKEIVKSVKAHVGRYQDKLNHARKTVRMIEQVMEYEAAAKTLQEIGKHKRKAEKDLYRAERRLKKLPETEPLEALLKARSRLDALEEPVWKSEVPTDTVNAVEKEIRRLRDRISLASTYRPLADKLQRVEQDYKGQNIRKLAKSVDREYGKYQKQLNRLVADISRIRPEIELYRKTTRTLNKIKAEIEEKEKALRDLPVCEMLESVYSPKGMKAERMREYAHQVQENMNRYHDLIFPEPMRFEFDVGKNRFDITAIRNVGKKAKSGDVRSLSGSESRAFPLLVLMSLLSLMPSRERTNILVLDEMDSGLDEEGRQMFSDVFIPELSKVIPHIIIVTPLNVQYPGSRAFTAVKEGNVSRLIPMQQHHD